MKHTPHVDRRLASAVADPFNRQAFLPPLSPMAMPDQDLDRRPAVDRGYQQVPVLVRSAVFLATGLATFAFAYELFGVLSFVHVTVLQVLFLILSTIAFAWVAFGSLSAALGFLPLLAGDDISDAPPPDDDVPPENRTALLFPVYHEDVARISGTISALAEELGGLGIAEQFDVFVLSDTRGLAPVAHEAKCYRMLRHSLLGTLTVFYRNRVNNTGRKAGNIREWVETFGAGYESFIIFDGDSVMSGEAVKRLRHEMHADPDAGLIQTIPRLVGGRTILQRLTQFASNVYGPAVGTGLAFWSGREGNYWGHNAIIRTRAFAASAGLPELPGHAPFGGPILSHDFVEAALLVRAGWSVRLSPSIAGSFESSPPRLVDLIVRDRRWSQGNLQHLALVFGRGIAPMGRVHLSMGILSYVISLVWALSMVVGIVFAFEGQHMVPSYFGDEKTLFPIWPIVDPGAALRLFLGTMAVVLLPKVLGLVLEIQRSRAAREAFGSLRATAGCIIETVFSALIAPVMMVVQSMAVLQFFAGSDRGWTVQTRDADGMSLREAVVFHWRHIALGLAVGLAVWMTVSGLLVWMIPFLMGLVLSAVVSWWTAREPGPVLSQLLSTHEDRLPAPVLVRADRHTLSWDQFFNEPADTPAAVDLGTAETRPSVS